MLAHIHGLVQKLDAFGFEALPHDVWGFEVHFPGELTKTVDYAVTWDINAVALGHGVQSPPHQTRTPARPNGRCDVSVRGHLPIRNGSHDVVYALVDVGCHPAR